MPSLFISFVSAHPPQLLSFHLCCPFVVQILEIYRQAIDDLEKMVRRPASERSPVQRRSQRQQSGSSLRAGVKQEPLESDLQTPSSPPAKKVKRIAEAVISPQQELFDRARLAEGEYEVVAILNSSKVNLDAYTTELKEILGQMEDTGEEVTNELSFELGNSVLIRNLDAKAYFSDSTVQFMLNSGSDKFEVCSAPLIRAIKTTRRCDPPQSSGEAKPLAEEGPPVINVELRQRFKPFGCGDGARRTRKKKRHHRSHEQD